MIKYVTHNLNTDEAESAIIPTMKETGQQLRFPHEAQDTLRGRNKGLPNTIVLAHQLGTASIRLAERIVQEQRYGYQTNRAKEKQHRLMNGDLGAEALQNKQLFTQLVRELGYQTPVSILVPVGADAQEFIADVAAMNDSDDRRFCKPIGGIKGKGIKVVSNPKEALDFVAQQKNDYLIQTVEQPEQDWRYILHRDREQMTTGQLPAWRIAYAKVRPTVVGDGQASVRQLVEHDEKMPPTAKKKYFKHNGRSNGSYIPEAGEVVDLVDSGNLSQGAYGRLPDNTELDHMDRFMAQFISDLETNIDGRLGTMCVDIGVKDPGVFDREYSFVAMKDAIVFYEFQVPFGFRGYLRNLPDQDIKEGLTRLLPENFYQFSRKAGMAYTLVRSMLISGVVAQRNS